MIVRFSPNHPINRVDPLLIPRAIREMEEGAAEYGIKAVGAVKQGVRIDTRRVKDSAALQEWLGIVAAGTPVLVTAEVSDLKVLCDNVMSPEAVGLAHSWPTARMTDLLPEELSGAVRQSFFDSYDAEAPDEDSDIGKIQLLQIQADLAAAGLAVPPGDRLAQREAAQKEEPREVSPEFAESTATAFDALEDSMGLL
jgi:hypothetical protein